MGGSPFPWRMEGGPVESDLRPQRPELVLRELVTVPMNGEVIDCFRLPPLGTVLILLLVPRCQAGLLAGSRCLVNT